MATPEIVNILARRLLHQDNRFRRLERYYKGHQPLAFATEKFQATFGTRFGASSNFCVPVVSAVAERMTIQGFRFGDAGADEDAWDLWQSNDLDADSGLAHLDALVFGRSYAMVWPDGDDAPRITVESPREVITMHEPWDRRVVRVAFKRWMDEADGYQYGILATKDQILSLKSSAKAYVDEYRDDPTVTNAALATPVEWDVVDTADNPYGIVPVVPILNRPRILGQGESELEVMLPLQDAVNKLLADMLIASELSSFRQRWATGLDIPTDKVTGQQLEPFNQAVSRLMVSEHETTKFGQFDASDLGNYTTAIDLAVSHIAAVTATPAYYFLGLGGQFPSGDSIRSAESGLVAKCVGKQRDWGEAWEDVMSLAFRMMGDPRADIADSETIWVSAEHRTESEHVDALSKLASLGVPQQQLWADAGYTPQQIESFRQMKRQESLDGQGLDFGSILGAIDKENPA